MDAAGEDAGPADAGPDDADGSDAGPADAGPADGGPADAGSDDAGPIEACPGGVLAEPTVEYVRAFSGTANQQVLAATVDSTGALLMTGRNQGRVDFGGGTLDAGAVHGVFVVKLDSMGRHLWSIQMNDTADDSEPKGITVDAANNVLVTGYVKGTIDFGGGAVAPSGSASAREIFVLKLDPDGGYLWANRYALGTGWGIATGAMNSVVVTGQASGTNDFGGGPLTASGQGDVFVLRLTASGAHFRSRLFGGSRLDSAYGIDVDATGAVVLTGQSYGGMDFGMGPVGTVGTNYLFVAKLASDDSHVFSIIEPGDSAAGHTIAFHPGGDVLLQGDGRGAVSLGGGTLRRFTARLGPTGAHRWSRDTNNAPMPRAFGRDGRGSLWIAGGIDPTSAGCAPLASGRAMFLMRLSETDGSFLGGRTAVGLASIWSVGVAPDGDVVAAGWVGGTGYDFGTGPLPATLANDALAVRYAP